MRGLSIASHLKRGVLLGCACPRLMKMAMKSRVFACQRWSRLWVRLRDGDIDNTARPMHSLASMECGCRLHAMRMSARVISRPSIAQRYGSREAYLDCVAQAARDLVGERLMLREDVDRAIERAGAMYDWVIELRIRGTTT